MRDSKGMDRRRFLQTSVTGVAGAGMLGTADFYRKHPESQEEKLNQELIELGET